MTLEASRCGLESWQANPFLRVVAIAAGLAFLFRDAARIGKDPYSTKIQNVHRIVGCNSISPRYLHNANMFHETWAESNFLARKDG